MSEIKNDESEPVVEVTFGMKSGLTSVNEILTVDSVYTCVSQYHTVCIYRSFSSDVFAAMLEDDNKRFLSSTSVVPPTWPPRLCHLILQGLIANHLYITQWNILVPVRTSFGLRGGKMYNVST